MQKVNWIKIASIIMFCGVAAGAFGAHALKDKLSEYSLGIWNTATLYLFIHGLAILITGFFSRNDPEVASKLIGTQICFALGVLIFSGSLYALAVTDIKILGAITPIGGVLFLVGWLLMLKI
jgi:uncharacterized membrane protein YgdD (TMEM256/DUF423 family)